MKKNLFFALILSLVLFSCEDYDSSHGTPPPGMYKATGETTTTNTGSGNGTTTGSGNGSGTTNTSGSGTTNSTQWMPLAIDNTWTMVGMDETSTMTIIGTEEANSYTYFITNSDEEGYTRFRYDAEGNLYSQDVDIDKTVYPEDKVIPADPTLNQTWMSGDNQTQFKVESLNATFGQYNELLSIAYYYSGMKVGVTYYKKGVGLVGMTSSFMGLNVEMTLTSYNLK